MISRNKPPLPILLLILLISILPGVYGYNHFAPVEGFAAHVQKSWSLSGLRACNAPQWQNPHGLAYRRQIGQNPGLHQIYAASAASFSDTSNGNAPLKPAHGDRRERRHGKSLISEAIVAEHFPIIQPGFSYCERHFSPYLPGGCCQLTFGNLSLRGPPAIG